MNEMTEKSDGVTDIVETIYRICSWLCIGAFLLIFSGIALILLKALPTPPLLDWILWLLVYALMLRGGWRKWIGKDKPAEPEKRSRLLSALIWIAVLHILYALWAFLAYKLAFLKYPFGINADYFLFPVFLLTAAGMTVFQPFRKHVKSRDIVLVGLAAGILWVWFFTMQFQPVNFDFRGDRLPRGYVMPAAMRERFFPEGASDFEIEGKHLLFSTYVNWNCRVSEEDFEAFCKKHNYDFTLFEVGKEAPVSHTAWLRPYLFYENRQANGGGMTLRYSLPEKKLYGTFSNR